MLSIEQLHLIQRGLSLLLMISPGEELPPIEALGEVVERELNYQLDSKPLQAEADRLLQCYPQPYPRPATIQRRLDAIGADLFRLSADRPPEFGGRFSAADVEAINIIREAAKALG
jgi:hypothetical protein